MSKLLEVPYNFESDYIGKLCEKMDCFSHIKCIYMPTWKDDGFNTRSYITLNPGYPKSYDEYVLRIRMIQSLGLEVCILAQKNVTLAIIDKYYALGVRYFTLNNDGLASILKEKYDDIHLTLSITRVLTLGDICSEANDYSMYDNIVLYYWFNRHLSELKTLPKKYKYTLLANCGCYYGCKWCQAHWFAKGDTLEEYLKNIEPALKQCSPYRNDMRNLANVEPENLHYFDPYVDSYKLIDREWETDRILDELQRYVERNPVIPRDEDYYNLP